MAANIVCYYTLSNKGGITMMLQVDINQIGLKNIYTKIADCHTCTYS